MLIQDILPPSQVAILKDLYPRAPTKSAVHHIKVRKTAA
jgi:hypothetical protein